MSHPPPIRRGYSHFRSQRLCLARAPCPGPGRHKALHPHPRALRLATSHHVYSPLRSPRLCDPCSSPRACLRLKAPLVNRQSALGGTEGMRNREPWHSSSLTAQVTELENVAATDLEAQPSTATILTAVETWRRPVKATVARLGGDSVATLVMLLAKSRSLTCPCPVVEEACMKKRAMVTNLRAADEVQTGPLS